MQANSNEPGDRPVFENHIERYNNMQDLKALEGKSLAELREIAKALGIKNIMIKKRELIAEIAGNASGTKAFSLPSLSFTTKLDFSTFFSTQTSLPLFVW